jgi:hypothetical protein
VESGIPDDVRLLLVETIESLRQVDALLWLRAADETKSWSTSELIAALRSSETALERDLQGLLDAGLVETVNGPPTLWRYARTHERTIAALDRCYRSHRTTVIRLVTGGGASGGSGGRGGGSSFGDFADAFRLRRKDPNEDG